MEKQPRKCEGITGNRLGLYAVYLMVRETALIDNIVDLLLETVHRISARSRRKIVTGIAK